MTGLADLITRLRAAAGDGGSEGPLDPLDLGDVAPSSLQVHREAGLVTAVLQGGLTVGELEEVLGPAKRLPRNPSGGARTVLFTSTLPADGESGVTVLAEIDEDERVRRLLMRPDSY